MLTFAWITFVLSALLLMLTLVVFAVSESEIRKVFLAMFLPFAFGALGGAQYIFGFTFLPYEVVIGMAFGAAAIFAVVWISLLIDDFDLTALVCTLTTVALVVFFALATVQHFWPHLITF